MKMSGLFFENRLLFIILLQHVEILFQAEDFLFEIHENGWNLQYFPRIPKRGKRFPYFLNIFEILTILTRNSLDLFFLLNIDFHLDKRDSTLIIISFVAFPLVQSVNFVAK